MQKKNHKYSNISNYKHEIKPVPLANTDNINTKPTHNPHAHKHLHINTNFSIRLAVVLTASWCSHVYFSETTDKVMQYYNGCTVSSVGADIL